MPLLRLVALVWALSTAVWALPAHGQRSLEDLATKAAALKPSPPRYIESLKFGARGVIFRDLGLSPSDPNTFYAASFDGFVFGSRDRGLSWREGRLVTQRSHFYGSIRASPAPSGAPFSLNSAVPKAKSRAGNRLSSMFRFEYGAIGKSQRDKCVLQVCPDQPGLLNVNGMPDAGSLSLYDSTGGGGGGGDSARLGIGLTRSAVWLQALLKKKRARLIGMNLKLMLSLRGVEPTWANHIAVNPQDPDEALVATAMGLFRTADGGVGWDHIFTGRTSRERWNSFVAYHPKQSSKVFLGTSQGLMISTDGANSFARPTGTQLSTAATLWVDFWKKDPNVMYAGTTIGVFRSDDGGANWRWIYYNTLPSQNYVSSVAIDPNDKDRVTIATRDGLFRTSDGGKKWERSGGFLFTSIYVIRLVANPSNSNHLVCSTSRNVWETFDWGRTWSALYINDSEWSPRALSFDPSDSDVFWVMTSGELLRISSKPPKQPRDFDLAKLRRRMAREPNLSDAQDATFRNYGVHRGTLSAKRATATSRYLLPKLHVFAGVVHYDNVADLDVAVNLSSQDLRQVLTRDQSLHVPYYGAIAKWDLASLLFQFEEAPYGRYFKQNDHLHHRLKFEVQRLYEERRRILIKLATVSNRDLRSRLTLQLRLEELTALLNTYTGGLYKQELNQLMAQPYAAPSNSDEPAVVPPPNKNTRTLRF